MTTPPAQDDPSQIFRVMMRSLFSRGRQEVGRLARDQAQGADRVAGAFGRRTPPRVWSTTPVMAALSHVILCARACAFAEAGGHAAQRALNDSGQEAQATAAAAWPVHFSQAPSAKAHGRSPPRAEGRLQTAQGVREISAHLC